MLKNVFYFTLKTLFALKIFNFLSWIFCQTEKAAWLERYGSFQKLLHHNLVKKLLQYTHIAQYFMNKGNQAIKFGQLV